MEITVADQRILLFSDQIAPEDAKQKAWEKRLIAFGALSQVTGFLNRPKDEDFELIYQEHRYQPFWHVIAKARYVYNRKATYQVNVPGKEVQSVTVHDIRYDVQNNHIHLPVREHCIQHEQEEVLIDGVSGKNKPELAHYLPLTPREVNDKIEKTVSKDSILVPPQARVSAIMRDALAKMIKGIQADEILEEQVEVTSVDLYYYPVYAFQYRWKSKGKEGIVEVDGMNGSVSPGSRTFNEFFGKVLDINFLFDVGADAAGMFIPGGSIAVKVAKKYMDTKRAKV